MQDQLNNDTVIGKTRQKAFCLNFALTLLLRSTVLRTKADLNDIDFLVVLPFFGQVFPKSWVSIRSFLHS